MGFDTYLNGQKGEVSTLVSLFVSQVDC